MSNTQTNNKNILYIGPYRQNDGWGQASKDYLNAILTTNHNVHCQPIYMASNIDDRNNISKQIIKAENNQLNHYDIIIQHTLPMMMYKTSAYTIGLLFIENQNFTSESVYNLNTLDEIWVGSSIEKQSLIDGGVTTKINVIGHPMNSNIIHNKTEQMFRGCIKNYYKFYFLGEYIQRKNLHDLIVAFHLEFDITEPVSLVLKLSMPGTEAKQSNQVIKNYIDNIKSKLRTKKEFHHEILITHRLSSEEMSMLHNSCDCFVVTSYGEAFCRPAAEALMHDNYLISSSNIGILEYLESDDVAIVQSYASPVLMDDPESMGVLDIYNGNEIWYKPDIIALRKQLRLAFENKKKTENSNLYINRFSHETIGQKICSVLI